MNPHPANPWRLHSAASLLAAPLLLLSACNMNAAPSPTAQTSNAPASSTQSSDTAAPTPPGATSPALQSLGLMRITFDGIGTGDASVKAESVPAAELTSQSLASVGGIQLQPVSTGSFVLGTRGAGGVRYLYATFKVRNASAAGAAYATNRTNLTLLAAGTPSSNGTSALSAIKKFDGTPADPAIATTILPTHGMTFDRASDRAVVLDGAQDLQVYPEAETASLPLPSGVTRVFPYGFVVRNAAASSTRTLTASPASGQFDGLVTVAMKLPLQASATDDPFTFSLNVEAVDDSVTRVTESTEEQGAGSGAATRATLLGAGVQVATLCGTSYSGSNNVFVGSATTAGGPGKDRLAHIGGNLALSGPLPGYAVFGNTRASVAAGSGLLSNYAAYPPAPGSPAVTLSAASSTGTTSGSTLNLSSDGSFSFTPRAGDGSGTTDIIGYTVSDNAGCTSPPLKASVPVTGRVWYARNDAPAGGDGRSDTPFQSLDSAAAASSSGDTLYVSRGDGTSANQASGLTLKTNQRLIGSGVALTLGAATLRPADANGSPTAGAVTLSSNNELSGLGIVTSGTGISGSNFGTLTASAVSVSTTGGPALDLSGGAFTSSLSNVSSTGSSVAGVSLTNLTGALTIGGGSVSGAAGSAFKVSGGSVNVTDNGTITQGNNAALLSVSGKHSGTLNFNGPLSATNGSGLQFDDADGTYSVNAAGSSLTLNGSNAGLSITNGSSGTFNLASSAGSASITNPSGAAITVTGSNPNLTYGGSITKTNGSGGVVITGNTGGTLTFSGAGKQISSSGNSVPVNLTNNTGATINFTGGGLVLGSATGTGFNVTGGGTVSVSGSGNTVTSAGGVAVNVVGSTIGSTNLTFQSVSANGGGNGIVLDTTGSGGFNVTGSGTTGSGGVIQNTSGADGAQTGNGAYLRNTSGVNLNDMNFNTHTNNAIYGSGVRGLTLNEVNTSGDNGSSNSLTYEESSVHLVDLGGTVSVTNSVLNGGAYDGLVVRNTSGTNPVLNLTFSGNTISQMQGSVNDVRNTAFQVIASDGTANVKALNNLLTYWWGNAMQVAIQGNATGTAALRNNRALQTSGALAAAGGIEVNGGNLTFDISNNTVAFTNGTAISVDKNPGNTYLNGTIGGNQIGYAAASSGPGGTPPQGGSWPSNINSGSAVGTGIFASHTGLNATTIKVSNNTIRQINGSQAIWGLIGDDQVGGGGNGGSMNATITGNNIAEEGMAVNSQRTGIIVQSGRASGVPAGSFPDIDTLCADLSFNSISNFNARIRPNQRFNTKMYLPGYTGASGDTAAVNAYLTNRNPGTTNRAAATTSGGGGYFSTAGGTGCPQPTTLP
ncbi:beta strand repeat-containing protein [Deinococcus altitudinis]|uniref:beta strand repeat-containing protein n=1 Tax=Deinococcus altitudinis TaxID=468914 RepID=UPI003891D372